MDETVVNEILKCSFCKSKFTKVVKLIPDCGSSICGKCYDAITEEILNSSTFHCKECNAGHSMPKNGLSDNKALVKMLSFQSQLLLEKVEPFKSKLDAIKAEVDEMKNCGSEQEINTYCDELAKQVMEAIDQAFSHLNQMGNDLLERIDQYKAELLGNLLRPNKKLKGDDDQAKKTPEQSEVYQELARLSEDIDQYTQKLLSEGLDSSDSPQSMVTLFESKASSLKNKRKQEAFKGRLMRFNPNNMFYQKSHHFGYLVFESIASNTALDSTKQAIKNEKLDHVPAAVPKQPAPKAEPCEPFSAKQVQTIAAHNSWIRQVVFLSDSNLASCSDDGTVKIWRIKDGHLLHKFEIKSKILSIAALPRGLLACGCITKRILVWDLNSKSLFRILEGHVTGVIGMQAHPNGNLVSLGFNETIKIWNLYSESLLLATITGHGVKFPSNLSITADGYIVACSNPVHKHGPFFENIATIRVWTSAGQLVKTIPTGHADACRMVALSNGYAAVAFLHREILLINLGLISSSAPQVIKMEECHPFGIFSIAETPQGLLCTGGSGQDQLIKIWDPKDGRLLSTIPASHKDTAVSMSFSPDGNYLATGSQDTTINVYRLNSIS